MNLLKFSSLVVCMMMNFVLSAQPKQIKHGERVSWFKQARFGVFIHYGMSSFYEGKYKGEILRNPYPMLYSEWIQQHNRIPKADYIQHVKRLSISEQEVDAWVSMAKRSGAGYVILTTKHHDGMALWPSAVSDYTLNKLSGKPLDIVGTYVKACRKYGLKVGFYYSHWLDFDHPNGTGFYKQINKNQDVYDVYWREKCLPQVAELITNYSPDLFWFDNWTNINDSTLHTPRQVKQLLTLIRKMDDSIVVNGRLGIGPQVGGEGFDYLTLGDNEIPKEKINEPWESAGTVNNAWAHHDYDDEYKSNTHLLRNLIACVANGGNYALNFGPMFDGRIHPEAQSRFEAIGEWLKIYGESVYGCSTSPFTDQDLDFGKITTKSIDGRNYLYLHVYHWPVDGLLKLSGLKNTLKSAQILGQLNPLDIEQSGLYTQIKLPSSPPSYLDTPIKLEIDGEVELEQGLVQPTMLGGYNLNPINANRVEALKTFMKYQGYLPANACEWKTNSSLSWKVYLPQTGRYRLQISYGATEANADQSYQVELNGKVAGVWNVESTGRDHEFLSRDLTTLTVDKPGTYTIALRPTGIVKGELMKFIWLYTEKSE